MEIEILTENCDFMVVNKPINLSVHNDNAKEESLLTLLNDPQLFLVHRLDKETSGVLILAKSKTAASALAQQFQDHSIKKIYTALVRGQIKTPSLDWKWALTDKAEGRKNPQGASPDRKHCETHGQVLRTNDYLSLIEVQIKTGRQHQIRKHAALAKHPILGDPRYNEPAYNLKISQRFGTARMYLHASVLEFTWQGKMQTWACPLPAEFEKVF